MATQATAGTTSIGETSAPAWPSIRHAGRVVLAAAVLGLAGQLLFVELGLGVNFPIAIGLLLVAGWRLGGRTPPLTSLDAWLAPAALAFATFAAVRADPNIVTLDALTALALTGAALAAFGGLAVSARPFSALVGLGVRLFLWAAGGAVPALAGARAQLPSGRRLAPVASAALPVARGLLLAIPVALVFVALFAAADAVFADVVADLIGFEIDLSDVFLRAVVAGVLGWLAAGGLALAAARHEDAGHVTPGRVGARVRIGSVEAVTVLVAVAAVFAVFVGLQGAYLFGGLDTLAATGLTYAEYARRGFFELVAVAILAGGLVIGLERLARERTSLLVSCAIALVVLTFVVLASATLRLRLYQEAYGWTELRLYVLATIGVLAIGGVALLVALLADRVRWMGHALLAATLAIGVVLNVIGPVRFITEQNVARALDPSLVPANGSSGLDVSYASSLDDDAVPALVRALGATTDDTTRELLREALGHRLGELRREEGLNAWQAWNLGREAARDALDAAARRGELP